MKPQELISKYIQNTLTSDEKLEFDRFVNTDKSFKEEVVFHENLKKVATDKDNDNFREMLSNLEANADKKKNSNWWYIAASVLVLLGVTYFISINRSVTNEELFATYFEPYRNITQPIVRGEDLNDIQATAFNAYEQGNYKKALESFTTLLQTKDNDTIQFYMANVLLKLNDTKKAISILEETIRRKDFFNEKRHWYLALAYLRDNKPKKAKSLLELLLKTPNSEYKKEEAETLLKKLQ